MRCYCGTALKMGFLLILLGFFYVSMNHQLPGNSLEEQQEVHGWVRQLVSEQFQSESTVQVFHHLQMASRVPFNISYTFLAGFPEPNRKFLTVGLSSVKRKQGFYLLDTLDSIFSQSSEAELEEMVVVVLLADFDMKWNKQMLNSISGRFSSRVLKGQLLVLHLGQEHYPPLEGLKRNFNDDPDRVSFRSKQNVDYAFLFSASANLSQYYIMLEDDILCSRNFLSSIKMFIHSLGASPWVTLEFSKLGYIGKLYHSSDLPRLASFLLLFYQEMPCDWLLGHFSKLLTQSEPIYFKPSLFQHTGLFSSFRGSVNHLKDEDFVAGALSIGDNPPAEVFTDIEHFKEYMPNNCYVTVGSFFWGKRPSAGNHFTIVLYKPAVLKHIQIQTGSPEKKDILVSADVEVGYRTAGADKEAKCSEYNKLGPLVDGQFDRDDLENTTSPVSCLRLSVQKSQEQWVVIGRINLWTKD